MTRVFRELAGSKRTAITTCKLVVGALKKYYIGVVCDMASGFAVNEEEEVVSGTLIAKHQ